MTFPWMRGPRPMNDEWLGAEIAGIKLTLENLERRQCDLAQDRQEYLKNL